MSHPDAATELTAVPQSNKSPSNDGHMNQSNGDDILSSARSGDRALCHQDGQVSYPVICENPANSQASKRSTNRIITSKYTLLTFIPVNLFEQFQNVANIYFLLIGILQSIPVISTTNGVPTMYEPLAFIVGISAIRAAKEDYDKHVSDNKRNAAMYKVLRPSQQAKSEFVNMPSSDLQPGDLLMLSINQMVPADCLIVQSINPSGQCFIDKSNLNGETRLEVVNSMVHTRGLIDVVTDQSSDHPKDQSTNPPADQTNNQSTEQPSDQSNNQSNDKSSNPTVNQSIKLTLVYEQPNKHFDSFRGSIGVAISDSSSQPTYRSGPVDGKSLLMRESILRNTDWIICLIVYTGNDTKIQKASVEVNQSNNQASKKSEIMRLVDRLLQSMLIIQTILCLIGAILAGINNSSFSNHWYLHSDLHAINQTLNQSIEVGTLAFFTWFIILASMVPISLIVSSEMVKFAQSQFIQWDIRLYNQSLNVPIKCNTSIIHEDLGCIDYIFSDKTGTLTQNKMTFRYALLDDGSHSQTMDEAIEQSIEQPNDQSNNQSTSRSNRKNDRIWEFGSKETDIAKSVRARKLELALKMGQTNQPANQSINQSTNQSTNPPVIQPVKRSIDWNELEAPFYAPPDERDAKVGFMDRHFPWLMNAVWNGTKHPQPINHSNDQSTTPAVNQSNMFTDAEREHLLTALWGPPLSSEQADETIYRKQRIFNYLLSMALSNTVKPYIADQSKSTSQTKKSTNQPKQSTNQSSKPGKTQAKTTTNQTTDQPASQPDNQAVDQQPDQSPNPSPNQPIDQLIDRLQFQAESAEELATVEFARSCGFTKTSINPSIVSIDCFTESDTERKQPITRVDTFEQLATLGFTSKRARVTVIYRRVSSEFKQNSQSVSQSTSQSSTSLCRPDTINDSNCIVVMSKGQDSVMLPLLNFNPSADQSDSQSTDKSSKQSPNQSINQSISLDESNLLVSLDDMSANGLRVLVCGFAINSLDWWNQLADQYQAVISIDASDASEGHPDKCASYNQSINPSNISKKQSKQSNDQSTNQADQPVNQSNNQSTGRFCEKCAQHSVFETIEKSANLSYIGVLGLEDQLSPLVPETINHFLEASIKVWMITGDKLETAKNIGVACNLIDADMMPSLNQSTNQSINQPSEQPVSSPPNQSTNQPNNQSTRQSINQSVKLSDVISAAANARLIQITGQWIKPVSDDSLLIDCFDCFDWTGSGSISIDSLIDCLSAMGLKVSADQMQKVIQSINPSKPVNQSISRDQFVALVKSCSITPFDSIKFDIEQGIKTYNQSSTRSDRSLYPVSILVERSAFQVLFPSAPVKKKTKQNKIMPSEQSINESNPQSTSQSTTQPITPSLPSHDEFEHLRASFFALAHRSKSVVFARAEPSMKKRMVSEIGCRMVGVRTLAVGDGANDADMIRAAHVGVGISGVEGTAATNASDYAIGSFRSLHTLLFVHGFWSYQRQSKLVHFIFYKASLVALSMFLFGFYSGFSGQQFFNDPIYQIYNVIYTALPVIIMAILDQRLPAKALQQSPESYQSERHRAFTRWTFASWICRAFLHALCAFFIPYAVIGTNDSAFMNGHSSGIWFTSTIVYMCVVLIPTLLILFEMSSLSFLHWFAIWISIAALILINYVLNSPLLFTFDPNLFNVVVEIYSSPCAWLCILLAVSLPLMSEAVICTFQREIRPTYVQVLQERVKIEKQTSNQSLNQSVENQQQPQQSIMIKSTSNDSDTIQIDESINQSIEDLRKQIAMSILRLRSIGATLLEAHRPHQHTVESININESINQSINQPINQSNEQSITERKSASSKHSSRTRIDQSIHPRQPSLPSQVNLSDSAKRPYVTDRVEPVYEEPSPSWGRGSKSEREEQEQLD